MRQSDSSRPTGHERPLCLILRLLADFATRKSSNEHWFSVDVTSLNKIGEGRKRDLIGDLLFLVTFKYPVLKPNRSEILVKAMTLFPMHVEHKSTRLQLSGPFWISNYQLTPGVVILNTRFGLLNMIMSSLLSMIIKWCCKMYVDLLLGLVPSALVCSSYK